jgi:hypothetical protein
MAKATNQIAMPSPDHDPRAEFTVRTNGALRIECVSDWCGDTQSGFGASVGVTLSEKEASRLLDFLVENLPDDGAP